jgi:hypothetical protein
MSLAQAIGELLAFVNSRAALPGPEQVVSSYSEWRDRFDTLDRAVWVGACRRGWEAKLPQGSGPPDRYLGLTKVPVSGRRVFVPGALRDWRNTLLALLELSEGADRDQRGAWHGEGDSPKRPRGRKPDTNPKDDQRIADAWASKQHKTYQELAKRLGRQPRDVKLALDRVRWCQRASKGGRRRRSK